MVMFVITPLRLSIRLLTYLFTDLRKLIIAIGGCMLALHMFSII